MAKRREDSPEYKSWRAAIIKRDKGRCRMPSCKRKGRECHHITRWHDAPHLRFEVRNGILLCKGCHWMVRNKEHVYASLFMKIVAEKK